MSRLQRFFAAYGLDLLIVAAAAEAAVGTALRDDLPDVSSARRLFEAVAVASAVLLLLGEQVGVDLGGALPAADHRHRAGGNQVVLAVEVVGGVQGRALDVEGDPRRGADAEDEVAAIIRQLTAGPMPAAP